MSYYLTVLKKYAVFEGRAHRAEYWWFVLFNVIISVALNTIFGARGRVPEEPLAQATPLAIIPAIYGLGLLLPSLAVAVRRLHDTGRAGWWIFIGLIPLVGWIVLIVFYVQDSDAGDNAYGANPKAASMT